ncbi:MAG: hypothetical protein ACRBFS_09045 [Aureispira sp.]
MRTTLYTILWWLSSIATPLLAQTDTVTIDSLMVDTLQLQQTIHYSYRYNKGQRQTNYIQETQYDTNGFVINQERDYYQASDTGDVIHRHYTLEYNPNTLRGFYQTEQLALGKKAYSIQKTTFRNYDRSSNKRYWVKTQKPNSQQLLRQVRYEYDKNGFLIGKEASNYATKPTSISTEKVTRNAAGNMLTWVSYDDDGDTKTQARSFSASYLEDSLLLRSEDQLYFNSTTVINKYDKNRQLKKTEKLVGNRSTKGKIKYNNETVILYKEGRPYKLTEKNFKKKVRTIIYTYEGSEEIHAVVTPEKSYTERIITSYHQQFPDLPIQRVETNEGEAFLTETWTYEDSTGHLLSHTVVEQRKNGKDWKNEEQYNEQGDIITKRLFVDNALKTEEIYQHIYQ